MTRMNGRTIHALWLTWALMLGPLTAGAQHPGLHVDLHPTPIAPTTPATPTARHGATYGPTGIFLHGPGATYAPDGRIYLHGPTATYGPEGIYLHSPNATYGPRGQTWLHTPTATYGPRGEIYLHGESATYGPGATLLHSPSTEAVGATRAPWLYSTPTETPGAEGLTQPFGLPDPGQDWKRLLGD